MACWITLAVGVGVVVLWHILSEDQKEQQIRVAKEQAEEAERKSKQREAWLQTPEGITWQEEQRELLRRKKEGEDQRRRESEESAARAKWSLYYESKSKEELSKLSGRQFEEFLARLFSMMGYTDIVLTPPNDQGGDIVCITSNSARLVVQAKRWKGSVGNGAVQELLGAMLHYNCNEGMVVTNSTFTAAARALAKKDPRVTLCDGRWLEDQVRQLLPPQIPEFSWEQYNSIVKDYSPAKVPLSLSKLKWTGKKFRHRRYGKRRPRW